MIKTEKSARRHGFIDFFFKKVFSQKTLTASNLVMAISDVNDNFSGFLQFHPDFFRQF